MPENIPNNEVTVQDDEASFHQLEARVILSQLRSQGRLPTSSVDDIFDNREEVIISPNELIQDTNELIVDSPPYLAKVYGQTHKYNKIFISIDNIKYEAYPGLDDRLKKVGSEYYLKKGGDIVRTSGGMWILKEDSVETWDGKIFKKSSYGLVECRDGRLGVLEVNCIEYKGLYFALDDNDVVKFDNKRIKGEPMNHEHKDRCVLVENGTHLSGFYAPRRSIVTCYKSKDVFYIEDTYSLNLYQKGIVYINKVDAEKVRLYPVIIGIGEINTSGSLFQHQLCMNPEDDETLSWSDRLQAFIPKHIKSKVIKSYLSEMKNNDFLNRTKVLKKTISKNGKGINSIPFLKGEKIPRAVMVMNGDISGGNVYFKANSLSRRPMFSQTLNKLGGMNYTFGVEHETCAGIVQNYFLDTYGLMKIGDGSTRLNTESNRTRNVIHYEYVTSVLHGDIGINNIYKYLPFIGKHVLMNESCSTHIHVGGQSSEDGRKNTATPEFNRSFSALSIILGAQIEDTLSAILPEYRNPLKNRYCSSIKGYLDWDISSKESRNKLIADYVFQANNLNKDFNSDRSLGKWNAGRYKWLNLTNCNSKNGRHRDSSFKTIEFRIFPATMNPESVHLWTLISMGFVWFVENRASLILKKNVTLQSMMKEVYGGKEIYDFIKNKI